MIALLLPPVVRQTPAHFFYSRPSAAGRFDPGQTIELCGRMALICRESLRDIETCLRAHCAKLYHLGIRGSVARCTLGVRRAGITEAAGRLQPAGAGSIGRRGERLSSLRA